MYAATYVISNSLLTGYQNQHSKEMGIVFLFILINFIMSKSMLNDIGNMFIFGLQPLYYFILSGKIHGVEIITRDFLFYVFLIYFFCYC